MLARLIPDRFVLMLLATIALASLIPAKGSAVPIISALANVAIFSLFFFHGLRIAREAVWAGLRHWRLQLAVLAFVFGAMPLLGLGAAHLLPDFLPPELWLGVLFLCALPSTVQAAIASSSMAGGNVAASVIAAALSNLAGVLLTPLLLAGLAHAAVGTGDVSAVTRIATLLLLPFVLGQLARVRLADWAERNRGWIGRLDRLTILITVYVAFSAAVVDGLWHRINGADMARLVALVLVLLGFALGLAWGLGRVLGLSRADRITLLFSGAQKSLATGAPMARILFPAAQAGMIVLPLMLYHQLQLTVSAWIAARLAQK
ncbi:MAG: bile acid:sodium symporter family protein [Chakrabartia sp.]